MVASVKQTYARESLEELFLVWNTLDGHGGGGEVVVARDTGSYWFSVLTIHVSICQDR